MKTSKQIFAFLRAHFGPRCLGVLTSQDTRALCASVALCPLISYAGARDELFDAYRFIVEQMQPQARWLAFHAIPIELDWDHRTMIWTRAGLDPITIQNPAHPH